MVNSIVDLETPIESDSLIGHDKKSYEMLIYMNSKKIPMMDIPLDIEAKYFKDNEKDVDGNDLTQQNLRSAKDNKKLYMDTYMVKMVLPSHYVTSSEIYPRDPRFCIQITRYILPENIKRPITHLLNGKCISTSY